MGQLAGWYDPNTIKYPPEVACILTGEELINVDDWLGDTTGNQSELSTTVGEMKTIIGVFYPSFYIGSRGNWTETEVREALTNDIEEAIYNFSDGNTKLVGPDGGHVMLVETPLGGFVNTIPCEPNTDTDSLGIMSACNGDGWFGGIFGGLGCRSVARIVMESVEVGCPECDIKAALILACPRGYYDNPPGLPYPLMGRGEHASMSWTWTDGMIGWNGPDSCVYAPGAGPGGYILEDRIELIENGRVKRVLLHEIMHSLNWGHTRRPWYGAWCPSVFKSNGPIPPCSNGDNAANQYGGQDNLGLMSLGGGCNNPYNVFEMHPTASTKYLRGEYTQEGVNGTWLPDNAVVSLDPSIGETHTIRLYAHDTPTRVKEDTLRDITTGEASDAQWIDPTTGEAHVPYLIKIKRPLSLEHCGSDPYCLADHDLFISYRREAWYGVQQEDLGVTDWDEGGYQNGALIVDWGPQKDPNGAGAMSLSLYKYDAADVRAPNEASNQTLHAYMAEDGSPNSTTTGLVQWPRLEIKIIENVGNNPPANPLFYDGKGPPSIVVEIKALSDRS